ncbi:general stress protein [Microbacterium sp. YY-03]|uniref:general stress protein n=1 Tax=Microbacterium sp. YY-03 TaxID=3421636 RepID=UPI003D168CC1
MSMMGANIGKNDIGETVASFPEYEAAQKAASQLIEADIPPRDIAIVGNGLRSVERITGRLGYLTAARGGLINGLMLGIGAWAIQAIVNPEIPGAVYFATLFICMTIGMALSFMSYFIMRRRRAFASVMAVVADHYDVTVKMTSIHKARQIMNEARGMRPRAPKFIDNSPPKYGERLPGYRQPASSAAHEVPSHDNTANRPTTDPHTS